ncbi:MAG: catechol-2,3-dioxygenase [Actinomycetes bacterium]|nr:MAG: catechol-2,3-dioxygenase [Actinomycetes bacterium]
MGARTALDGAALACEDRCMVNDHRTGPAAAAAPLLPADLALGPVHLIVTDLDRSTSFYERSIGLRLRERDGDRARLGAGGGDLLVLHERPGARPAGRHAGLYHFALLHPTRGELGRAARRLAETGTSIEGASDHGISEAIYLPDPDGNGIELAADRPRERWGDLRDPTTIGPAPLDLPGLIAPVAAEEPAAGAGPGLRVGHLHLHVGDIAGALAFYRDVVGFELMTDFGSAAFVAAGGYHHHLGLNTWRGRGVPPAPDGAVGLERWTVELDAEALAALRGRFAAAGIAAEPAGGGFRVRDPWGIATSFQPAGRDRRTTLGVEGPTATGPPG